MQPNPHPTISASVLCDGDIVNNAYKMEISIYWNIVNLRNCILDAISNDPRYSDFNIHSINLWKLVRPSLEINENPNEAINLEAHPQARELSDNEIASEVLGEGSLDQSLGKLFVVFEILG
ncbi:MAG: hypothetical protein J3R72DRAFT_421181 [Linnemannia gamsii]|nr:MAG: hypothetical protein J3R72DRAFT_421181 [Linnemannia gamsii]